MINALNHNDIRKATRFAFCYNLVTLSLVYSIITLTSNFIGAIIFVEWDKFKLIPIAVKQRNKRVCSKLQGIICLKMFSQPFSNPSPEKSVLPKNLSEYLESPKGTIISILKWINARWQLRKCDKVGRFTRVTGKVFVNNMGQIVIGERVLVLSRYAHSVLATFPGGKIEIGDRTFLNYGIDIAATKLVKIGKDCQIGTHVVILDNDFHMLNNRYQLPAAEPVIINNNVWIGNRALILPGVTIGENSIIGAGSVVVKSIPANSVAVGNPAKVIKEL